MGGGVAVAGGTIQIMVIHLCVHNNTCNSVHLYVHTMAVIVIYKQNRQWQSSLCANITGNGIHLYAHNTGNNINLYVCIIQVCAHSTINECHIYVHNTSKGFHHNVHNTCNGSGLQMYMTQVWHSSVCAQYR